jgi:hypothetical protein
VGLNTGGVAINAMKYKVRTNRQIPPSQVEIQVEIQVAIQVKIDACLECGEEGLVYLLAAIPGVDFVEGGLHERSSDAQAL